MTKTIEGVVAQVSCADDQSVLTVFPITQAPDMRIDPASAIDLTLRREAWQTRESHRDHVTHIVGRRGIIQYDDHHMIAAIRHH